MGTQRFYTTEQLSPRMAETPEGFLVCYSVPLARTGEYIYKANEVPVDAGPDGIVKIQRDEDEVFSEETIKSFEGKPVTINHPNDFVTPENWNKLANGVIQNVHRGDGEQADLLIGDLVVTTEDAIKLIKAGLRQVSLGYDAQYEQIKPGLGRQTDIVGNHVALVVKGRAGNRCAIMDKACECCGDCMCGKNNIGKEDISKMKSKAQTTRDVLHRMFPKLNLSQVKDEDLEMGEENPEGGGGGSDVEVVQQLAAEAKSAAVQAVEAAKQASEAVEKIEPGGGGSEEDTLALKPESETEETDQAEGEGEGDPIAALNSKIDALTALVQQLVDAVTEEEGGEESFEEEEGEGIEENPEPAEKPEGDAEGEEKEKDEKENDVYSEDGEENENIAEQLSESPNGLETKDSWQGIISRAEIIAPGIIATKPTTNVRKVGLAVKRRALNIALTKDNATIIKPLLRGKKVSSLTEDVLDTVFVAASEIIGKINNSKIQKPSMQMKDLSSHSELSAINKRNKEFWTKKS